MATEVLANRGAVYTQAAQFANALEARENAAELRMLAAWSDAYWGTRQSLDGFLAKMEAAKAAGLPVGLSWGYQEGRLRNVLAETQAQILRYSQQAATVVRGQQRDAIHHAVEEARALTATAVASDLPGLSATFARVNPAVLEAGVGFLQDGSVLAQHLAATMPTDAAAVVREALVQGLSRGKSQDWMRRAATQALGLSHGRAVTILRTESLRAYREASRRTYQANADVVATWTWNAALDARCCIACVLMDGTEHPLDATLDGHPRCRCAMVPRTKTWEELGVPGLDDTRPPVRKGREWLEAQPESVQRGVMGRAKYQAWKDGKITLDDMVGRHQDARWGTMRTERSLKAIQENRNANWFDGDPIPVRSAAPDNLFTPGELSAALSPARKRTKAAILKELEGTKAGKDLAAQIKAFTETRGGVANLRKNLTAALDGSASPAVQAKARAFLDAMDAYPTTEVPALFRGMAVKVDADTAEWWDAFEGQFTPGSTFDLNASSFTSSEKKAAEFSRMIGGTRRASSNYTAVRFYLEDGAHALPVEALSKFKSEREWITGGRFQVTEFSPATPAQPYARVVIRQAKGLGK